MEYEPLKKIEQEITKAFKEQFINGISLDDLENMNDLISDLKDMSDQITDVKIVGDDQDLAIEFLLKSEESAFILLERDEDFDCWI